MRLRGSLQLSGLPLAVCDGRFVVFVKRLRAHLVSEFGQPALQQVDCGCGDQLAKVDGGPDQTADGSRGVSSFEQNGTLSDVSVDYRKPVGTARSRYQQFVGDERGLLMMPGIHVQGSQRRARHDDVEVVADRACQIECLLQVWHCGRIPSLFDVCKCEP